MPDVPLDPHRHAPASGYCDANFVSQSLLDTCAEVIYKQLLRLRNFSGIEKQAKKRHVCIAIGLPLPPASKPEAYDDTIRKLTNYTESKGKAHSSNYLKCSGKRKSISKLDCYPVVILFAVTQEAERVLRAAENSPVARDRYTWIASDGWAGVLPSAKGDTSYRRQLSRKCCVARIALQILNSLISSAFIQGSIGFMPKSAILPEFDEYFRKLRLKDRTGAMSSLNPWFAPYLSQQLGCKLQGKLVQISRAARCESK